MGVCSWSNCHCLIFSLAFISVISMVLFVNVWAFGNVSILWWLEYIPACCTRFLNWTIWATDALTQDVNLEFYARSRKLLWCIYFDAWTSRSDQAVHFIILHIPCEGGVIWKWCRYNCNGWGGIKICQLLFDVCQRLFLHRLSSLCK